MEDSNKKIQEIYLLEQNLQNLILQKQAFQMEISETQSALKEIETAGDEIFKVIGQLMIKSEKSSIKKDLENKEKILSMRVKSIEKQEIFLTKNLEKLREEIIKSMKK